MITITSDSIHGEQHRMLEKDWLDSSVVSFDNSKQPASCSLNMPRYRCQRVEASLWTSTKNNFFFQNVKSWDWPLQVKCKEIISWQININLLTYSTNVYWAHLLYAKHSAKSSGHGIGTGCRLFTRVACILNELCLGCMIKNFNVSVISQDQDVFLSQSVSGSFPCLMAPSSNG